MPTVWEAEAIRGQEIATRLAQEESFDRAREALDALAPDDKRAIGLYAIYMQRMQSVTAQEGSHRRWLDS